MRQSLLSFLLLASCTAPSLPNAAPWRPTPIANAVEPSDVIAKSAAADWREIAPEYLLIMDLKDGSRVAIELAPAFAPVHVSNIRALARAGWWDGATVYRVQENYVVQWGVNESPKPLPSSVVKTPAAEYDRPLDGLAVRALGFPDPYAPMAGYAGGWPIGYDPQSRRAWLAHCYATVGVGRDVSPDTGTGGELYAVIGHAPRHLDLNIASVGRVVDGFSALTARPRGTEALGFIKDPAQHIPIARARLAADMPEAGRPRYEALRTDTATFAAWLTGRANRGGSFFIRPAGGVDLCNALPPVRKKA
jgi:peptidylprolyl isomerase